ncbi:hypothetical protein PR202_gb09908 [Eleusine coracana subsp. coracana]|uniref:Cyclin C-terminal domain-containing protein n=1 Tax=Eleusine coracana subsp. coracana TaxID=191504 RepID=A0AAV5EHX3_ELECO|nr:hypothetical protein PR202_gb09908 [Eleusine coracana subsp. coracana]
MVPGYDCAASVLLCAEDNAAVLGLDEEGEESSWPAGATPPRAAAAGGVAVEGYLADFPLQSDECIEALVEREEQLMPVEGYLQKLHRRHGDLDLGGIRKDAIDWIWKVAEAKFVFEGRTIKRMELLVLSTLKWRMQAVTACSFIDYFLHKLSDHGAPSMLARSRSADLILSTAKGAEFLVFRPSEIAASVALAAMGELRSSILERAATGCNLLGSSLSSVPQSPIGVLDAGACLSQQSDDATVGSSPATCLYSSVHTFGIPGTAPAVMDLMAFQMQCHRLIATTQARLSLTAQLGFPGLKRLASAQLSSRLEAPRSAQAVFPA